MRVFNDGMAIERGSVIHLQDDAELMGIDQIDDTDADANEQTQASWSQDEPITPTEFKGKDNVFKGNFQFPTWQEPVVNDQAEVHGGTCDNHHVRSIPWNWNQSDVHEYPKGKTSPKEEVAVISGLSERKRGTIIVLHSVEIW